MRRVTSAHRADLAAPLRPDHNCARPPMSGAVLPYACPCLSLRLARRGSGTRWLLTGIPAAQRAAPFQCDRSVCAFATLVVDVSKDTTAQNETPLAVNPLNAGNL